MTHPNVVNMKTERTRKWDVAIGRNTPWGNPYPLGTRGILDRCASLRMHEAWVRSQPDLVAKIKAQLKGKVLACYCAPLPCHGDTLATIAEEP